MNKKTAYLCKGCGLDEALDFDALIDIFDKKGIKEVKISEVLCTSEALAMIKNDIKDGVDKIIIGACSSRVKVNEFDFTDDSIIVERCPLREQVLWCSHADDETQKEDRQMLAEDYLRMSIVKINKTEKLVPFYLENEIAKTILVVGGGPAGMNAALAAAETGSQVFLVEKEDFLGGFQSKMYKLAPQTSPYRNIEDNDLLSMIEKITNNSYIKVFTSTTVDKTEGAPGNFDILLSNGKSLKVGAIIQATGWLPYDPKKLIDDLAYGSSSKIVTNVEFELMAKEKQLSSVNSIAFIQCAGSRDINHLPYCSAFCCLVSCKQSMYIKEINPEASVYIIYKDIRTPNQSEEIYREAQRQGVIFIRRDETYPVITVADKLKLEVMDVLLNHRISLEDLDLVVLATGMKPNNPVMMEAPIVALGDDQDVVKKKAEKIKAANDDWSVLNLQYRQGLNLPSLKYAMPDSHFICFPYETRRTGIYAVGTVRRPMRLTQAKDDGIGAVMKAIHVIRAVEAGCAVHPRSGDKSYPEFAMQRCTQCKRCTEECPFGAINEDEKGNPLPNPTRCRRCGVCLGACPERIVSFKDYTVDMISSIIKTINVPEEDEEKPRIICLVCENDALPAIEMAASKGYKWSSYIRFIPMRCLGSLNLVWIADALSSGIDGVLLLGCRYGDDYQCHFVKGSELANVRMSKVSETLTRLVLESERVQVSELAITDIDKVPEIINNFIKVIESVGPNPYKEF